MGRGCQHVKIASQESHGRETTSDASSFWWQNFGVGVKMSASVVARLLNLDRNMRYLGSNETEQ